jgi:hypothetical protein
LDDLPHGAVKIGKSGKLMRLVGGFGIVHLNS